MSGTGQNPPSKNRLPAAFQEATQELLELLRTSPPGTFKRYKGQGIGTEENILKHLENYVEVRRRGLNALRAGCWIECIELRLQLIDFWLRVFFVNRASEGKRRQREFGRLLEQCKELGFDRDLVRRISEFNKHRINACHGFVVGRLAYREMEVVVRESMPLSPETALFVLDSCGEPAVELREGIVGDMIMHARGAMAQMRREAEELRLLAQTGTAYWWQAQSNTLTYIWPFPDQIPPPK